MLVWVHLSENPTKMNKHRWIYKLMEIINFF